MHPPASGIPDAVAIDTSSKFAWLHPLHLGAHLPKVSAAPHFLCYAEQDLLLLSCDRLAFLSLPGAHFEGKKQVAYVIGVNDLIWSSVVSVQDLLQEQASFRSGGYSESC